MQVSKLTCEIVIRQKRLKSSNKMLKPVLLLSMTLTKFVSM